MKYFLLILGITVCVKSTAQNWCPAGAMWFHTWNEPMSGNGYTQLTYVGDTLINSITCNIIKREIHGIGPSGSINGIVGRSYTYYQNGIVYIKDNANILITFDTLFKFKANIGDRWHLTPSSTGACSNSVVNVLDTGTVNINSINLKWLKVSVTRKWGNSAPYDSLQPFTDTIIERIGSLNGYFYGGSMCPTFLDRNEGSALRCYSDNQFGNYKHNFSLPCNYITGIKEPSEKTGYSYFLNSDLNCYQFKNENNWAVTIRIFDVSGKVISTIIADRGISTLYTQGNAKGFYFFTVLDKNQIIYNGKLINF